MRKLLFALTIIVMGIMVVWAGDSRKPRSAVNATEMNSVAAHMTHTAMQQLDSSTTIDGAVTPQLVPDTVAYSLFFNFFSDRAESERGQLQSYCNQTALVHVSLDGLLRAAAYYRERVAGIDAQAEALRNSVPHDSIMEPQTQAQFSALRLQREAVINEAIAKLPDFIGAEGALAVRRHIDQRIKTHTKIVPGPRMPGDPMR